MSLLRWIPLKGTRRGRRGRLRANYRPRSLTELEPRTLLSVGGGFANGGLTGQYYPNANFSGTPAFTRVDDRIDFNWGGASPAGSNDAGFAGFPGTNWSVKWTGSIIPQFSESYTFITNSDAGIRVIVNGKTVINDFTGHAPTVDTGSLALTAGETYSIEVDYYYQGGGASVADLSWSSPSTPQGIIDEASPVGIGLNGITDYGTDYTFANAWFSAGTPYALNPSGSSHGELNLSQIATVDAQGNPTEDFGVYINEANVEWGTYAVSGYASQQPTIGTPLTNATIGPVTYNASTHLFATTVTVAQQNNGNFLLEFRNTGGGVTGLKVMRPTSPGTTTSLDPGTLFTPQYEQLVSQDFTTLRYMDLMSTNGDQVQSWSQRALPSETRDVSVGVDQGVPLEFLVELANETGKDIWINIPEQADNTYVTNLADLLKYGSDGVNPYTSQQVHPVYPGLNPGVRVYIEYSNEVWNGAFTQNAQNNAAATAAVLNQTPDGQIIDYDGIAGAYNSSTNSYAGSGVLNQRYHALRTVEASDIFRSVWGDAAMSTQIRPLLEWQYGGGWYGDDEMLPFINNYFNNADGLQHVAVPHAVDYFLWGGGGAWYTGTNDTNGNGEVAVTNSSFESGATGWTFSGTSGVVVNGNTTLNPPTAPDGTHAAYITGTGSISQTVTIPAGEDADVNFDAGYTGAGDPIDVTVNGTDVGSFIPGQSNIYYAQYFGSNYDEYNNSYLGVETEHTHAIFLPAGSYTIRIAGTGSGTSFIDNLHVGTVDGIFNSGLATISVPSDVKLAQAYGLQDAGYEGGFVLGGDYGPTDLESDAALDPRATAFTVNALEQFYRAGGALPMQFGVSGGSYNITDTTFDPNASKAQGYSQATDSLPAATTNGIALPATVGQSVAIPETSGGTTYLSPSTQEALSWNFIAVVPGTYSVTLYGTQDVVGGLEHFLIDGQRVPGSTSLPVYTAAAANSTTLTFAISTPGLHTLSLYVDGPGRITLPPQGNETITLVSAGAPGPVPAGFSDTDIGAPGEAGQAASYDGSEWTVSGGGQATSSTFDQLNFASQPLVGDGAFVARVLGVTNSDPWAEAGVMIRGGTGANAAFASTVLTPGNGIAFQWRNSTGGNLTTVNIPGVAGPVWVKLVRVGNSVSGYYSTDGTAWTQVGSAQVLGLPPTAQAGLAVSSQNNNDLATANFTNVAQTPTAAIPTATTSAAFVKTDAATQGNWEGVYGGSGYDISQETGVGNPSLPAYASVSMSGQSNYTWASSTNDPRAPPTGRPG